MCITTEGWSQNKELIDSLENRFLYPNLSISEQLSTLKGLAVSHPDPSRSIFYSDKLLALARSQNAKEAIIIGLQAKGNALTIKGDLSQAIEVFMHGVDLAKDIKDPELLGGLYVSIADVYSVMENKSNTILYYKKAIEVLQNIEDKGLYATAIENLGDEYNLNLKQPDSALFYFEESSKIWMAIDDKRGQAFNIGNKGLAYAQLKRTKEAEVNINKAIQLLEELGDYYAISVYLMYMSDIYLERGDNKKALSYTTNSLNIAKKYGLKDQIADAYLKLSELHENNRNIKLSYDNYKNYIVYRDSVKNIGAVREIAKIRHESDLAQKQKELDLSREKEQNKGNIAIAIGVALFLIVILAIGLYRRTIFISKTKQIIEKERNRSDKLLLNILPEQTAQELKDSGSVKAMKFDSVSVLFTDFKGFTNYAEELSPELLVKSLGFYFSEFDNIIDKYGLEKIKTIGDAYMCAGGLPYPSKDHAKQTIRAAMEMNDFVNKVREDVSKDYANFDIRVGINSGPVVAGVVGTKKIAYDIWGDTVNVASRMESMSDIGRINIGELTYQLIKDDFECEYRGEFDVKNRGKMKMYFVNADLKKGS